MELTRYALQLETLERRSDVDDDAATRRLRGELALAQNAGYFDDLSAEDFQIGAITRSAPQQDVTRYGVDLLLEERTEGLDDEGAQALVRRAFADAMNASYLSKASSGDQIRVRLVSRGPNAVVSPA